MWSSNFAVNRLSKGNQNNGSVQLGSVMNLNLNVISAFGLNFAANLQSSIEENETRVFADTTLHGISGKKINFQNTNTYRYRDNNVDPETGKPIYSGVTREIISGIKIDILGRVSGNGMITSTVTASVTRQGVDTSSSTGNPPPTTEKIVTTEVCGKSGEVVVLSGLIQNAQTETEKRTPIFSKIPILGNLFKNKNKINQNSQMVIYLVPYLENLENKVEENIETWVINRGNKFLNSL
jgi:Flp pilus assembly secretin CpaC